MFHIAQYHFKQPHVVLRKLLAACLPFLDGESLYMPFSRHNKQTCRLVTHAPPSLLNVKQGSCEYQSKNPLVQFHSEVNHKPTAPEILILYPIGYLMGLNRRNATLCELPQLLVQPFRFNLLFFSGAWSQQLMHNKHNSTSSKE